MNEQRIEISINIIDGEFYANAKHGESFVCSTAQPTIEMSLASIATYLRSYAEDALDPSGFAKRDPSHERFSPIEFRCANGTVYRCTICQDTFLNIDGEPVLCPACDVAPPPDEEPLSSENLDAAYDFLADFGQSAMNTKVDNFYSFLKSVSGNDA